MTFLDSLRDRLTGRSLSTSNPYARASGRPGSEIARQRAIFQSNFDRVASKDPNSFAARVRELPIYQSVRNFRFFPNDEESGITISTIDRSETETSETSGMGNLPRFSASAGHHLQPERPDDVNVLNLQTPFENIEALGYSDNSGNDDFAPDDLNIN